MNYDGIFITKEEKLVPLYLWSEICESGMSSNKKPMQDLTLKLKNGKTRTINSIINFNEVDQYIKHSLIKSESFVSTTNETKHKWTQDNPAKEWENLIFPITFLAILILNIYVLNLLDINELENTILNQMTTVFIMLAPPVTLTWIILSSIKRKTEKHND